MNAPRTLLLSCLLTLAACSQELAAGSVPPDVATARAVAADPAATADQVALAMVQANRLGANLKSMAGRGARMSTTYAMIVQTLGKSRAEAAVAEQINTLLPLYQPQWDRNLAKAYAAHMTQEQMRSIAMEGKDSPYFDAFMKARSAAADSMRERSAPILEEIVFKSLSAAMMQESATTPDSGE